MSKRALLIGVNQYPPGSGLSSLKYAEKDAKELAAQLESSSDFDCTLLLGVDATRDNIEEIVLTAGTGDTFLFFFAGHGQLNRGQYLLHPIDSNAVGFKCIPFTVMVDQWHQEFGFEKVLAILDSCRSQTRGNRGTDVLNVNTIHRIDGCASAGPRFIEIVYGCSEGQFSYECEDIEHGQLTHALLEALRNVDGTITSDKWIGETGDIMRARCLSNPSYPQVVYRYAPPSLKTRIIIRQSPDETQPLLDPNDMTHQMVTTEPKATISEFGDLERGATSLFSALRTTLGPRGRPFALQGVFGLQETCCGANILSAFSLKHSGEQRAVEVIRSAAWTVHGQIGDGATTTAVLACKIFLEALEWLKCGAKATSLLRGIQEAAESVQVALGELTLPTTTLDQIRAVATSAAKHDVEGGALIADAMDKVGKYGLILVEEGLHLESSLELAEGMKLDRGFLSAQFLNAENAQSVVLDKPYVLLYEGVITELRILLPLLEKIVAAHQPLLIFADDVEKAVLATLLLNNDRQILQCCAVRIPGTGESKGEIYDDIAAFVGARPVRTTLGEQLDILTLDALGRCKKCVITRSSTEFMEGSGEIQALDTRAKTIEERIRTCESDYTREKLEHRLANLVGGVAIIRVGGDSASRIRDRKTNIESALHATVSSLRHGMTVGAGVALLRARSALTSQYSEDDRSHGRDAVRVALCEPFLAILDNADLDSCSIMQKVETEENAIGFDVVDEQYVNLYDAGIVDPVEKLKLAILHASRAASLLLDQESTAMSQIE